MTDPSDGHPTMIVRKDHVKALVEMIEQRERIMLDFVLAIEISDNPKEMCRSFWFQKDKWK
jgi:hypothetical protein